MVLLYNFVCMNLSNKYLDHKIKCILFIFFKIEDFRKNTVSFTLQLFSCLKLGYFFFRKSDFIFGLYWCCFRIKLMLISFHERFFYKNTEQASQLKKQGQYLQSTRHSLLLYSGSLCSSFITAEILNCEAVPAGVAQSEFS